MVLAEAAGPLLTPWVDPDTYEYTNHLFDLTVVNHVFFGGFLEADFANNGRGRYYRDPLSGGTPGTYGTFPPNATSPSSHVHTRYRKEKRKRSLSLVYSVSLSPPKL